MASKDGSVSNEIAKEGVQPARVTLTGHGGGCMNVTIGKIKGSVTVGNKTVVTHHYHNEASRRKGQQSMGCSSTDSESEWGRLESESEKQTISQNHGVALPTDQSFEEEKKKFAAETSDQPTRYEEQTRKFEKMMTHLENRAIDDTVMHRISSEVGKDWRRVFRHLKFSDDVIDRTFTECGQVQETVYKLLMNWTRVAVKPDVKTLVEALVRADQAHIVHFIEFG